VTHLEFAATNTAALSASNLPIPTAAAAYNHLDAIARATKAAGDPRSLDQIRADEPLRVLWRLGYPRLVSSVGVL
jgi:hypothetical protein